MIHVTWGFDPFSGRPRVARGVLAAGPVALGLVAVGPLAVGLVAAGALAVGLVAGMGAIAAGFWAAGQVAVGGAAAWGSVALSRTPGRGLELDWTRIPLAAVWLAAAVGLGAIWWRAGRPVLRLIGTPRSIAFTAAGAALVRGRVVPVRTARAPVSRRDVVAYELRRVRQGRPAKREHTCEDFFIDDGTGRARIHAADARLLLDAVRVREAPESQLVAQQIGGASTGPAPRVPGTAFERTLRPGDEVVVCGQATRQLGAGPTQVHLAMHGGAAGPVLVTNRDLDEMWVEAQFGLWLATPMAIAALIALL